MTRKNYGGKDNAKPSAEGFKGDPNGGGRSVGKGDFQGFVNPKFEEKDKADFEAWLQEPEDYFTSFTEMCSLGWQVSVKFDPKNQCYMATASTWDGANQNCGWMLPLRAPDPARALAKCVWALTRFYAYQIHNRGNGVREGELW